MQRPAKGKMLVWWRLPSVEPELVHSSIWSSCLLPSKVPTRLFSCSITQQSQVEVLVHSDLSILFWLPALLSRIGVVPPHRLAESPAPQHRALRSAAWAHSLSAGAQWPRSLHTAAPTFSSSTAPPVWCHLQVWQQLSCNTFQVVDRIIENYWMSCQSLRLSSRDMPWVTLRDCSFGRALISLLPKPPTARAINIIYSYLLRECAKSNTLPKSIPSAELLFPTKLLTSPKNIIRFVWKAWFSFNKAEQTATNSSHSF